MVSSGWQNYGHLTLCKSCAGDGLKHGRILYVEDQVQDFKVQIEVSHKVSKRLAIYCGSAIATACGAQRGTVL